MANMPTVEQVQTAIAGLDASLDEAMGILRANDVTKLPPWAQQVTALLGSAWNQCPVLMQSLKVDDPDDAAPAAILTRQAAAAKDSKAITMANGTYPIVSQKDAQDAWDLRNHSKTYSEAQVVSHIRVAVGRLGLTMPKNKDGSGPTTKAASKVTTQGHGFVFPGHLPPCAQCGHDANDSVHVNPPRPGMSSMHPLAWGRMVRASAAAEPMKAPRRSHAYTSGYTGFNSSVPCLACGQPMGASIHPAGMMAGQFPMGSNDGTYGGIGTATAGQGDPLKTTGPGSGAGPEEGYGQIVLVRHPFKALPNEGSIAKDYELCALCGFANDDEVHQNTGDDDAEPNLVTVKRFPSPTANTVSHEVTNTRAFVTSLNGRTIVSAPASILTDPKGLPRALAEEWTKASEANPNFMWIEGRFVEADSANRNRDFWSTDDLQIGEPTVAHGPLNWLHEERHIIGTIAGAKLVMPDRSAAAAGENAHIRSLAAVWRYLWPMESRVISMASDSNKLWYSMECVSKTVACQEPGCGHSQAYAEFMREPATRCPHVKAGAARRYVEPRFLGGAVIVPPKNPGWGGANATVMRQAAMLAEGQEAAFGGMTTTEAELMVASIIDYAQRGNA